MKTNVNTIIITMVLVFTGILVPIHQAHGGSFRVPDELKVPDGHQVVLKAVVTDGAQTYTCTAEGKYELLGPSAVFRGRKGEYVAHYFGPSFQYHDGSTVVGKVKAMVPRNNTIPELLVEVVEHKGPDGLFSNVDFVQRLRTLGGVAPAQCDPSVDTQPLPVPYFAVYKFWAPK